MIALDFQKIFYSNFPISADLENLQEISWMYEEEMFSLDRILLASSDKFQKRINQVLDPKFGLIKTGESYSHMALKSFGTDYLKVKLKIKPNAIFYEYPLIGFEVDLIDKGLHYPIECGDTSPIKLEKYLNLDTVINFSIIPYPRLQSVFLYKFVPNKKFKEYINFKKEYLNKKNASFR